jgi:phosphoesterase RecJ-like protein
MLRAGVDWRTWDSDRAALAADCDAVIVVDTSAWSQLEPIRAYLDAAPRTLVIDHHATGDALGTRPGDLRLHDESASATCLILAEWAQAVGIRASPALARALFVGIATDCGWFRFSNTDARTLRAAAGLMDHGVAASELHAQIYQQDAPEKLRLIGRMLGSLELHAGGKLAVMSLRRADFEATGATAAMTEDLVNEAGRLGCTEATLLLIEQPDGIIRANLRSKTALDVAALAARFGGGGHSRAAGTRLKGAWDDVVPPLVSATIEAVSKLG